MVESGIYGLASGRVSWIVERLGAEFSTLRSLAFEKRTQEKAGLLRSG
jgi:hypothetical protein